MKPKRIPAMIIAVIMVIGVLASCTDKRNELIGSWKGQVFTDTYVVLTFDEGGKGSVNIPGDVADMKWSVNGDKLNMTAVFSGEGDSSEMPYPEVTYRVSGDSLYITNDGETREFVRCERPEAGLELGDLGGEDEAEVMDFDDIVAVDNDSFKMTFTDIAEGYFGYEISAVYENKTDIDLIFNVMELYADGVSVNTYAYDEVPAGKINTDVSFLVSSDGTVKYTDCKFSVLEMVYEVRNANDSLAEPIFADTVTICPSGEDEAAYVEFTPDPDAVKLVDNDMITIYALAAGRSADYISIDIYAKNKSGAAYDLNAEDVCLDNILCSTWFNMTLAPGKCGFDSLTWYQSTLDDKGVNKDDVKTAEITFVGEDKEWNDLFSETVTINVAELEK